MPLTGVAAPHVHPRIEPSALAPFSPTPASFGRSWTSTGEVSYPSLERLVADLRAMGATNILQTRPLARPRCTRRRSARLCRAAGDDCRTVETFELLHFAAGRLHADDAPLTLPAVRVVNPACLTSSAWTWIRGGWRDRYPETLAHARERRAWSNGYRIRAYLRADHHRDDGRPCRRSAAARTACGARS